MSNIQRCNDNDAFYKKLSHLDADDDERRIY